MRPQPSSFPAVLLFFLVLAGSLFAGVLPPLVSLPAADGEGLGASSFPPPLLSLPPGDSGIQAPVIPELEREVQELDGSVELKSPYSGARAGSRTLLRSDAGGHNRALLVHVDGTIYLMDTKSRTMQWKLSTGSPILYSEQALSSSGLSEYFMDFDEDWNFYEYSKHTGKRKFDLTFEDYVTKMARKPKVNESVVTVGAITTNMYILEADSGMVVYTDQVSGSKTTAEMPWVEGKSVSYQGAKTSDYIIVMRTNYFLNSSVLGTPLWSLKKSDITAYMTFGSAREHELPSNMDNKLELPPMDRKDVPVILLSSDGKLKGASHDNYMLPLAAHLKSAITLYEEHGKKPSGSLPLSVCSTADSCSQALVAAPEQISVESCPNLECHLETERLLKSPDNKLVPVSSLKDSPETANGSLGNKDIAEPNTNKMFLWRSQFQNPVPMPYDNTNNLKTLEKSCEGLNNGSEVKYYADERTFSIIFSKVSFGVMALLLILLVSTFTVLCYLKLRVSVKYDKNVTDLRGQQSAVPKKRKARKAGNVKNGVISNNDREPSSESDNYETDSFIHIQNNERHSFVNLRADDVVNGRWVGRLFVSNSEIGRGSNGTVVFEGVYDGRPVAVKRLLLAHHDVAFKEIQNLIASDRHPNIVRWYGVEQDLDFVYISLERCACSLSDLIQAYSDSSPTLSESQTSNSVTEHKVQLNYWKSSEKDVELWKENGLPSSQLLKLMRDVVSGLAHLHELGIIHRDLKPQNVLISTDRSLNAKLSDMGISKRLLEDMSSLSHHATGYGSSGWQAPEQLLHGRQTRAVDLFSLGCILFYCITKGKHPFGNYFERDSNIINNRVDLFLVDHIPEVVHLLSHLLDPDPKMRPNAIEVLHHPFFWSSEMRLSFLRDTSDRIELEDRENKSELMEAIENATSAAFGGKWNEKLDAAFITDMGRYRKYKFDCMRDLLRVIRNKFNHYRELPKELQEILGPVPEGFDRYFSSRFPNLLIEVYKVVCTYCREEDSFSKYFKRSLI
ncbi:serine/threonine-protein kinase/endoribonuclease IRE1-like [Elaeis guineensis]|uniref:serine/threonine-protein kinase/endoribonuclease IRE1-like n=1 Tax=Elaeis guineensis var. tenera TaxID=51953 RepID=UPI003C6D07FC